MCFLIWGMFIVVYYDTPVGATHMLFAGQNLNLEFLEFFYLILK